MLAGVEQQIAQCNPITTLGWLKIAPYRTSIIICADCTVKPEGTREEHPPVGREGRQRSVLCLCNRVRKMPWFKAFLEMSVGQKGTHNRYERSCYICLNTIILWSLYEVMYMWRSFSSYVYVMSVLKSVFQCLLQKEHVTVIQIKLQLSLTDKGELAATFFKWHWAASSRFFPIFEYLYLE